MANPYLTFNGFNVRTSSNVRIVSPFYPIPPYTMRFQFIEQSSRFDPTQGTGSQDFPYWSYGTWTHVAGSVYDWTYQDENWRKEFTNSQGRTYYDGSALTIVKNENGHESNTASAFDSGYGLIYNILGANVTGVKSMAYLCYRGAKRLNSVALFDTSHLECAGYMFGANARSAMTRLTNLPNFDFSSINDLYDKDNVPSSTWTSMKGLSNFSTGNGILTSVPNITLPIDNTVTVTNMFYNCKYVESGALTLYNKFVTSGWQGSHGSCFKYCGSSTTTGAAELAQIPTGWGGTMSA